jgi:hypothetical protein
LKVAKGSLEQGTEDPVDSSGVEAELGEANLEFSHVVAAQVGMHEIQQALAEPPTGFDESGPGDVVNFAGDREASRALERFDQRNGLVAKKIGRVGHGRVTEFTETLVKIAHTMPRVATSDGGERQVS